MALSPTRQVVNSPSPMRSYLVAFGAGALLLALSLVNLLRYNDYSLIAPEVLPIYAGIVALAAVLGAIYLFAGRLFWPGLDAFLVMLAVDLNSDSTLAIAVAGVVSLLLAVVLRRSLLPGICFGAAVALGLSLIGLGDSAAKTPPPIPASAGDRPAILHLLLDEHAGIEGFPEENPRSPEMRDRLKAFYLDHGFRLYGRAYSEHMYTVNAAPQIMNLGEHQPAQKGQKHKGVELAANAYFDRLQALGYGLIVYQNSFVDLCGDRANIRCISYSHAGLSDLAKAELSDSDKTATIVFNLLGLSSIARYLSEGVDNYIMLARWRGADVSPMLLEQRARTSTLHGLAATDRLIADLEKAKPGQAYVAHLLLPHSPYILDADCRLRPRNQWAQRRSTQPIREREAAYFDQVLCATGKVTAAMAALERSTAGQNYIVVVHGDHGSRITVRDPKAHVKDVMDRDLIAGFSTLFAVKASGIQPGYEERPAPVSGLLRELAASNFSATPDSERISGGTVMLANHDWFPVKEAALPPGWLAASAP